MSSSLRLYCTYRPVPVAEVLEYVPASVCATCEAHAALEPVTHAVLVFVDGFTDTAPISALMVRRLEDVSPM